MSVLRAKTLLSACNATRGTGEDLSAADDVVARSASWNKGYRG